jgi:transcriptional regulator with XRE-family HTH domain
MTQLAARLGITYNQMHRSETGINHVSAERLYQLSLVLGVSPDYFFEDLSDDKILSAKRSDARFNQLSTHFIRLNTYDQGIVIWAAHLFAHGDADLATPDLTVRKRAEERGSAGQAATLPQRPMQNDIHGRPSTRVVQAPSARARLRHRGGSARADRSPPLFDR